MDFLPLDAGVNARDERDAGIPEHFFCIARRRLAGIRSDIIEHDDEIIRQQIRKAAQDIAAAVDIAVRATRAVHGNQLELAPRALDEFLEPIIKREFFLPDLRIEQRQVDDAGMLAQMREPLLEKTNPFLVML